MATTQDITNGRAGTGPKGGRRMTVAIVGPFQSGKTTLLEAILARTGALQRPGSVEAGRASAIRAPRRGRRACRSSPTSRPSNI